jgi:DeoR/GlpR family transcriptional regulator of sugar metabolism
MVSIESQRFPAARLERLRELVIQRRALSFRQVMQELGVSEMTVRRDFAALEELGFARRTHGGVVAVDRLSVELPHTEREVTASAAKDAIGALAASLVHEGDTVIVGSGTTCLAVARSLARLDGITVITNSIPALPLLIANPAINAIATGGSLSLVGYDMVGPLAEATVRRFRASKAFVGSSGITAQGSFDTSIERAAIDRLIVSSALEAFVVADSAKFGVPAVALMAELDELTAILTDAPPSDDACVWLERSQVEVRVAAGESARRQRRSTNRQHT